MQAEPISVTLAVANLVDSSIFYRDGLGFQPMSAEDASPLVIMRAPGLRVILAPRALFLNQVASNHISKARGLSGVMLAYTVTDKRDVTTILDRASRNRGTITRPAADDRTGGGGYSGYVADPDGNVWEIAWVPSLT
jgi:predicted lactoylglutathione lyase